MNDPKRENSLLVNIQSLVKCNSFHVVQRLSLMSLMLAILMVSYPVHADGNAESATRVVEFFKSWLKKNGASQGSIAVSYDGQHIMSDGVKREATAPMPVASLSKTITGICISQYLEEVDLSLNSTIGDILGDRLKDEKIKKYEQKSQLTVKHLLNQTSGIKKDITQKKGLLRTGNFDEPNIEPISIRWLKQKQKSKAGEKFYYNNGNFAVLGMMIEAISGMDYEQACLEKTLKPIGITDAKLNPKWKIMSSWGGWMISAEDYLKFVNAHFSPRKVTGKRPQKFGMGFVSDEIRYGAGFYWKNTRKGNNYWHSGRWSWDKNGEKTRFGSYFAYYATKWAVTVNYNIVPSEKNALKLDKGLWQAIHES